MSQNHKDENKLNDNVDNLEWYTHGQNRCTTRNKTKIKNEFVWNKHIRSINVEHS